MSQTSYSVTVVDSLTQPQTATATFKLTVNPLPIVNTTLTSFAWRSGMQQTVALLSGTGGNGVYTYRLVSGSLPAGVTLNANTGELRGAPTGGIGAYQATFDLQDTNGINSSNTVTIDIQVANFIILRVGSGLAVGSKGVACLADGDTSAEYDPSCVSYGLVSGLGFVVNSTYVDVAFTLPVTVTALQFIGYWRQAGGGSLGNWEMEGCSDTTCDSTTVISNATSLGFSDTLYATSPNPYIAYRLRFVGGFAKPNGGSGRGNFSELIPTIQ